MKRLIVNADDFGYGFGVNKGIIKAHREGIVTSTSVMVFGEAAKEAKNLLKYPKLSVGLHFYLVDDATKAFFVKNLPLPPAIVEVIRKSFERQVAEFVKIVGKPPDHLDGHQHIHKNPKIKFIFQQYLRKHKIPVRDFYGFRFIDSFFAWDKLRRKDFKRVSVESLLRILGNLKEGVNELMCHPGYVDEGLRKTSSYLEEREKELETLTDKKIVDFVNSSNIKLCNWKDIPFPN